ncbi:MAG: penicillin-binding protein 2 [Candidatus Eremiobacteraeota bacterium]|nr:penicillin-binding protein 2 [Candidatus Eremiobacteraeota bacterium]
MNERMIRGVSTFFTLLFALLIARQGYVQIVKAPSLAAKPYNPRHALLGAARGRIVARDGTVLAATVGEKRGYPMGESMAQTVGYASGRYGTSGIESAYDRALTPPDTTGDVGSQLEDLGAALAGKTIVSRGADVVTTIDPTIQQALFASLSRHARGAGVVLDARSGAVLALVSVPSFDPNSVDQSFGALSTDAASPLLNRALSGLYPPGSTFKMFTAAAALDSGTVTMQSTFEDPGYLAVGNFVLHDDESEATGYQDLTGAFALSSNVDFGKIALKMGADTFYTYLDRWGIGGSLDFQIPAENGRVPPKSGIFPGELAQMGFGQAALLMTPLQMALIGATIANGGNEPRPFIVRNVVRAGIAGSQYTSSALTTPVSADTAENVKKMMVAVVRRGTGTIAQIPGTVVAGKTGTATTAVGKPHSWFVCFAPAENPRIVVAVVVEHAGYGAAVAAPIARNVLIVALQSVRN